MTSTVTTVSPPYGSGMTEDRSRTDEALWSVAVLDDAAQLALLRDDWQALEAACDGASNIFQTFDWCHAWAETYAAAGANAPQLHVVTARQDGRLLLVWPLMIVRTGPFNVLRWLSEPFGQYGDVLVDPVHADDAIARAWRALLSDRAADTLRLRHVREDAAVFPFLERQAHQCGQTDTAPALKLAPYPDEAAYDARYTKVQRRRRKRIRKELEKIGPLRFTARSDPAFVQQAAAQAIAQKRVWLDDRGLHSDALACPRLLEFLNHLSRNSATISVLASQLDVDGRPVSFEIGLRHRKHHFGFITAHDPALTDASPARLHMDYSQRQAIRDGLDVFDLMVPGDPHKASWSNSATVVHDFFAPMNLRGALYGHVYLACARPVLRRAFLAAPVSLRQFVTGLLGH